MLPCNSFGNKTVAVVIFLWLIVAHDAVDPNISAAVTGRHMHTVQLRKQLVPVMRGDRHVAEKTAYFGTVSVGEPVRQDFTVVFDTGSGNFVLPSVACESETCKKHKRYDRSMSSSVVDIDHDGTAIDIHAEERDRVSIAFGTWVATGEFAYENVCLGSGDGPTVGRDDCVRLRVVLATEMTEEPFSLFKFDGILGLGLDALTTDPEFSLIGQMASGRALEQNLFGVYISRDDEEPSEITFGGINQKQLSSSLQWVPVARPELGYWQVQIKSVTIAGKSLALCEAGDCHAIVDTGTSMLGVPKEAAGRMHWSLARAVKPDVHGVDCRHYPGPAVVFDLGGFSLTLGEEDYSRPAPMKVTSKKTGREQVFCRASLLPVDVGGPLGSKVFLWGEPLLRRYFTAYQWEKKQIGFADAHRPLPLEKIEDEFFAIQVTVVRLPRRQHPAVGEPTRRVQATRYAELSFCDLVSGSLQGNSYAGSYAF